jgi:hypothetical protein
MLHLVLAAAVAFSPARIDSATASLDGIATEIQKRTGVPGLAIAVVRDGTLAYANDVYGPAIVSAAADALNLTIGPKHMVFPLRHWSGDTFVFRPGGGGFRAVSELTFRAATSDRPAQLTIEWLNESGLGTFTKSAHCLGTNCL